MKKTALLLLTSVFLACFGQTSFAQLYGRWILPIASDDYTETYQIKFEDGNVNTETQLLIGDDDNNCRLGLGGYDLPYNRLFYFLEDKFCYNNHSEPWSFWNTGNFDPEAQIIFKPESTDRYFIIFSEHEIGESDNNCMYNEIWIDEQSTPQISNSMDLLHNIPNTPNKGFVGIALTEEAEGSRYLYTSSKTSHGTSAGIRRWTVTSSGIGDQVLIQGPNNDVNQDEFAAYNLEMKSDDNDQPIIAWITSYSGSTDKIFLYINDETEVYDLNLGRIGGIEFSTLYNNILYVSCNSGIVEFNYQTGQLGSTIKSGDYQRTYLQTAPDGHIYGVANGGHKLGRINMETGIFEDDIYTIPGAQQGFIVSTFHVFDNNNYYVLPENQRTFNYMTLIVETTGVCPGGNDGTATVFVNGGFSPYTFQLYKGGSLIQEASEIEDGEYTFTGLSEGIYVCKVIDDYDNEVEITFEIEIDEGLFNVDDFFPVEEFDPEQWTNINVSFQKGFHIKTDVTISNSTLTFGKYARVIVDTNCTLTLDNTTFDYFEPCHEKWRGVEVAGMSDSSQWNKAGEFIQGRLILQNNSRIKNAENGVSLYRCDYVYIEEEGVYERRIDWDSAGGIIIAKNSHFINNTRAVHFIPYRNYHPYTLKAIDNISDFELCNFELNTAYIDSTTFYKHVDLHGVLGIDFKGCSFSNTAIDGVDTWNMGIAAYGSGFTVRSVCNTIGDPCPAGHWINSSFEGFFRGIANYESVHYLGVLNVSEAQFSNNIKGILNYRVDYSTILDCNFEVGQTYNGDGICPDPEGYGIDMQESNGFCIENNTFTKYATAPEEGIYAGIQVLNCPSVHDIIYKNSFEGLYFGNYAKGRNRLNPVNDQHGVEYQCNENNNNTVDFIVTNEGEQINGMIRNDHGSEQSASGNVFSPSADWHVINEGTQTIDWFYCTGCNYEEPLHVYTLEPDYFHAHTSDQNGCPDHYGGGGGHEIRLTSAERQQKETDYAQNFADYNSVSSLYESLIDGGDTEAELNDIQSAQPDDMWNLRAQLLGDSPHLSQEVLREMSDRTDIFPDDVLLEILSANPDELTEDTLINYLEQKEDPLPDYMIEILRQASSNVTYKTILKREMAQYHAAKTQVAQDIIRSILNDTVVDLNDYRDWLDNLSNLEVDKQIIASYLSEGDTVSANSLLDLIPDLYDLQGDDLNDFNDYKTLLQMQMNWHASGKNIFQIDSNDFATLQQYANGNTGDTRSMARSILSYGYNYQFCDCMQINDSIYNKSVSNFAGSIKKAFGPEITAVPNPADTWVAFNYKLKTKESVAYINITDASGKIIQQLKISGERGQKIWDTRYIKPGIYFYTMNSDGLNVNGKIIIN